MLDIIMMILDVSLFAYFYNIAINTTDMTTRLFGCLVMTMQVFFIRRHLKIKKLKSEVNKSE